MRRACILILFLGLAATPLGAQQPRLDAVGDPLPVQALHRFGTARFCTQAEVLSLVLSQDGKLLAAADREGRVYLWEAATGKQLLRTRTDSGKRVVISPDGQWLASGEEFPFELRKISQIDQPLLPIGNGPRVFAFTPDSKAIALSLMDDADVLVLDLQDGKEIRRFAGLEGVINAIAFSPDGKRFAAAAPILEEEKPTSIRVVVWDAVKGEKLKEWVHPAKQVKQLVFLPDNKTLVGQFASRLAAWDVTTGAKIAKINQGVGSAFDLDRAGKMLATTDGPRVVEFASGKELHDFDAPALLRHLTMSGDGKLLAASPARFESASPRLLIWDLSTGKPRRVAEEHSHFVDAVAFSQDGLKIATASNVEGVARVWDARTSKLLNVLNLDRLIAKQSGGPRSRATLVDGLAFSPYAPELFVAGQRWDLTKSQPIKLEADDDFRFEQTNSRRAVLAPDGRMAASFLTGQAILFWDPSKAKQIQKIEPTEEYGNGMWTCLAFAPNGKYAATGKMLPRRKDDDDTPLEESVYLWEIATGKLIKKMRATAGLVARLMFSPDGETLAVISLPTKLEFWHLPSGRMLRETPLADLDELPRVFAMPTVAFAPHGQWIAFTYQEGRIVLLETITGKEIHTLRGHQGYVSSLAFSPDNRRLLSGGRDTAAIMWEVIPDNPPLPAAWKDADALWLQLGGAAEPAYKVAWALMAHPQHAVEVLGKRLQPDTGATDKEIRELIKNLSAPKFAQRDQAITRLKQIGTRSFPALEQALKIAPDLETSRRIRELLRTVETALTPETLRDLRALQILEMIGTPAARALLTQIAGGDAGAAKTRLARAALDRGKQAKTE
jgi:WD40 repeat protein